MLPQKNTGLRRPGWLACIAWLPALVLRYLLAVSPDWLWYDEAFSVLVARLPLREMFAATAHDVHPPLYYLILKAWLWLWPWSVEVGARSLSLLFALIAILLFWRLTARLGLPRDQAVLAMTFVLYTPSLIFFAAEARMYSLMMVLVLGVALLWLPDNLTWGKVSVGGVGCGLLALTHNAGLYYCAALAAAAVIVHRRSVGSRRILRAVAVAAGIALLIWLPWGATGFRQQLLRSTGGGHWTGVMPLSNVVWAAFKSIYYMKISSPALWPLSLMLFGGVTTWSLLVSDTKYCMSVLAYQPLLLGAITSLVVGTGSVIHRVLVPGVPFLMIAWAGLLRRRDVGRALLPLVIFSLILNCGIFLTDLPCAWPVSRHVADYRFLENEDRIDLIYGSNTGILPMLLYSPVPVWAADVPDFVGAGLTPETENLLGIQKAPLETLEWQRAYLLFKNTGILESDQEREYAQHLIDVYDGQRVPTADSEPGESYLWLLTRR